MELTKEFYVQSLLGDWLYSALTDGVFEKDLIHEVLTVMITDDCNHKAITGLLKLMEEQDYTGARKQLQDGQSLAGEILDRRRVIKSLLKGLIVTSAITGRDDWQAAADHWSTWDFSKLSYESEGHHQLIYAKFCEAEIPEDLEKFNIFFHGYIRDLVFNMAEMFITRTRFMISYLHGEDEFAEACRTGTAHLDKFERELNELKK